MKNENKGQYYNPGDTLWRHGDNALFQIIAIVCDEPVTPNQNKTYYRFHCINGVTENDEIAYCDLVATGKTALSPIAPSKLTVGQHIWDKANHREFVVKRIIEPNPHTTTIPCDNCHDGVCEQCIYGYKSEAEILSMLKHEGVSETAYELLSNGGMSLIQVSQSLFEEKYTMYPPMYVEDKSLLIVETDKTGKEIKSAKKVELDLPDKEEEDEEVLGMTDEEVDEFIEELYDKKKKDSYQKWKDSLHVVQVPAFDLNYFKRGVGYHVEKHACYPGAFDGILMEATEDLLKVMKLGNSIHFESTEIIEIPLKEYLDGKWHIVRLVEEGE